MAVWARRPEAAAEVQKLGIAEVSSTDLATVAQDADFVVLAVPIGSMGALARQVVSIVPPGAIITDVGSVKAPVVEELSAIFHERGRFGGSHPMAGSEQTGIGAARAGPFRRRHVHCHTGFPFRYDGVVVARATKLLGSARVAGDGTSSPGHPADEIVALVSHFPHLLAASLVDLVIEKNAQALQFAGPGFRDTTRIASGPPEMWTEILRTNHVAVRASVEAMIEKLREIRNTARPQRPDDRLSHPRQSAARSNAPSDTTACLTGKSAAPQPFKPNSKSLGTRASRTVLSSSLH